MKIISMMCFLSPVFLMLVNHPLTLVLIICLQSLLISLMVWTMFLTAWFSLVLFLIFMGGLMVLFIYISSLASNETFNVKKSLLVFSSIPLISSLALLGGTQNEYYNKSISLSFKEMIFKIYSNPNMFMTLMIMLYLLVVLIVAVSIISMYEGPLRNTS